MPLYVRARLRAQAPFLSVLAIVAAGFVYLLFQPDHWRRGTGIVAIGLLCAAVLRLVLAPTSAGMLAVRTRWFDTLCYATLGVLILIVDIRLRS